MKQIRQIESALNRILISDKYKLKRDLSRLKSRRKAGKCDDGAFAKGLEALQARVDASLNAVDARKARLPETAYPPSLPVTGKKEEIIQAIREHQTVIVSGETGSGKTTQIPKLCMDAGRGAQGIIGCTQPRRIAAVTVSARIAEELGEEVGRSVGYKIRFQDKTGDRTCIKIMTDGVLLAETRDDPFLNAYDTLIVDEAHERSLNIDFILGMLKTLLKKRRDLKLIITSATIDTEKFSRAFGNAPVVEIEGRTFPVETRYWVDADAPEDEEQTYVEAAVEATDRLFKSRMRAGDILIFMPTEQDIRETCEMIEGRGRAGVTVYPLFARLSAAEQTRVFAPVPGRKIIVATNIAETSITIPGVRYVIDTGLARIPMYFPKLRATGLPVSPISRSSADQRKGRCGRMENGVCIRLYSEEDYAARPMFTQPEILRSNLAEVLLRMIDLGLGAPESFPFIDPPAAKSIKDGFDLLAELGAVVPRSGKKKGRDQGRYALTDRGRIMAGLPIDPRLSRMLIAAAERGCIRDVAVIAAALSIQDPRERPAEKAEAADQAHAPFRDAFSDFLTLRNIWKGYRDTWESFRSASKLKKFCKARFLSFRRMREWRDIHGQISNLLKDHGFESKPSATMDADIERKSGLYAGIHQSVLSGFLSNIAFKKEKNIYKAARGKEVMLFPGSGLFNKGREWIVAAEMVETSRLFARTAADIDADWLEPLAKDLCKYTWSNPRWLKKRGEVAADEQASLFGLVIVSGRPVSYGRINPDEACDIFIREALIAGDTDAALPFLKHNQAMVREAADIEDRFRQKEFFVGEEALFDFYKARLDGIYDIRSLKKRIREKGGDAFLRMTRDDVLRSAPDASELALYPDAVEMASEKFACSYRFEPGDKADGITLKVPGSMIRAVSPESLEWMVPGYLKEKIEALVKSLPKQYRKQLVPLSDTVDIIVREMPVGRRSLYTELGNFIHRRFGVDIPASAWSEESLPDHLKMRISVTTPEGKEIASGRGAEILNREFGGGGDDPEFSSAMAKWEKKGIAKWDFGDLPDAVTLKGRAGKQWAAFPGLAADDDDLSLRLFQSRSEAVASHVKGVVQLYVRHFSQELKFLKRSLALPPADRLPAACFGGAKALENGVYEAVIRELFSKNIRTETAFYAHAEKVRGRILDCGKEKFDRVRRVLKAHAGCMFTLNDLASKDGRSPLVRQFLDRMRADLDRLIPPHFFDVYNTARMPDLERYIAAIGVRAERALLDFEKDRQRDATVQKFVGHMEDMLASLSPSSTDEKRQAVEEYFWMLEEYKVSVFAQELKTPTPVSEKRLKEMTAEIERMR